MKILVCAATAMEISPFLKKYQDTIEHDGIDVLITGIGLTATTYSLTKYLGLKQPELVIQAGIAGCFDTGRPLATVLAVRQEAIADQGVVEEERFKSLFDLNLVQKNRYPYKKAWMVNPDHAAFKEKTGLSFVKGISVNQITSSKQQSAWYRQQYNPVTESMEGAALHFTCLMDQVPFLQLRSLSNYIGERDRKKWKLAEAVSSLNNELERLLKVFSNQ